MTDASLDVLASKACDPLISVAELRRVALVAIGELSMLRKEYAGLKEATIGYAMAEHNFGVVDPCILPGVTD